MKVGWKKGSEWNSSSNKYINIRLGKNVYNCEKVCMSWHTVDVKPPWKRLASFETVIGCQLSLGGSSSCSLTFSNRQLFLSVGKPPLNYFTQVWKTKSQAVHIWGFSTMHSSHQTAWREESSHKVPKHNCLVSFVVRWCDLIRFMVGIPWVKQIILEDRGQAMVLNLFCLELRVMWYQREDETCRLSQWHRLCSVL